MNIDTIKDLSEIILALVSSVYMIVNTYYTIKNNKNKKKSKKSKRKKIGLGRKPHLYSNYSTFNLQNKRLKNLQTYIGNFISFYVLLMA